MTDLSQLSDAQLQALISPASNTNPSPLAIPAWAQTSPQPATNLSHLSDAQLGAIIADTRPNMPPLEDVARSVAGGVQRGVAGVATAPRSATDAITGLAQSAVDFAARHGVGDGSLKIPSTSQLTAPPDPTPLLQAGLDFAGRHGLGTGGVKLPPMTIRTPADAARAVVTAGARAAGVDPGLGQLLISASNPVAALSGPTTEQGAVTLNNGVPIHVPQTTAGRYAQRIAEFSPMLTTPGSMATRLANMIVPAAASQGAQDMAPEGFKGAAATLGALLGGGAVAMGGNLARAPQASFGNAMEGLTDDQMQAAQALRQDAATRGLDLSLPEAVQQVTNNGTGLGRLQRVVESTKQGQQLTAPYFSNRPGQVSDAVRNFADTIAPSAEQPGMIGVRAQDAATTALDRARQVVNQAAGPDYAALPAQTMDQEAYQTLASNPSYRAALGQLRGHPELGATVAQLPDNNLSVINAVKQRLATMGEQAQGTPLQPGDNQLAGLRFGARGIADQLARSASPEYAAANDTVRQLSGQYVDPLKAGPLGAISATQDIPAQTGALYPRNPIEGAPNETAQAVRVLGNTAPGVADDLTRQHVMNALDSSMRSLQGGQNQYAGAKLAVAVAGSPEQAATLRAGISALPEGDLKSADLDGLLEALKATGKRQQPGSMTAFNAGDLNDLHIAPYAQAISRIGDPLTWGAGLGDILNRANYRRNVSHLADMIMSPPESTAEVLAAATAAAAARANPLLPALLAQPGAHR